MVGHAGSAPLEDARATEAVVTHPRLTLALRVVAVVASAAALLTLARQPAASAPDDGVRLVPALVPWLTAGLSIATAVVLGGRRASSAAGSIAIAALVIGAAWSCFGLLFDAFGLLGLAPPPVDALAMWTRILLLAGSGCAVLAAVTARRASQPRCPTCERVLPGRLDRLPRWPAGLAVASALVYPLLRVTWALGGTFGLAGEPLEMDPVVAWAVAVAGMTLLAVTVVLFLDRGPTWVRALLGLGSVGVGIVFATIGLLGGTIAVGQLAERGLQYVEPDLGMMLWTFLVVYVSWLVTGLGIVVGGWRFWARRRVACPACGPLLEAARPAP